MSEEQFQELLTKWVEGDVSPEDGRLLEECLREDPSRQARMREELRFADLLEQQLCPWRSYDAFVNGLETRTQAEQNGDEFIRELIPKLREVDRRQAVERKVVNMPGAQRTRPERVRHARWMWFTVGGGLAAAAGIVWLVAVVSPDRLQGLLPVASITEMENVVWQTEPQPIEWKVGDQLKAGEEVRLLSGRARFRMSNGNVLTLEGPADLRFLSENEGVLSQGAVLADVRSGSEPFRVRGLGAEIAVEPGTTEVRILEGDRVEAKQSRAEPLPAEALAQSGAGEAKRPSTATQSAAPGEAPKSKTGEPTGDSGELPHYRIDGDGAPVLLVLEDDDLRPLEPIRVDVIPGGESEPSLASPEDLSKRPAIGSVSRVRSYLVQVGDSGKSAGPGSEYVDATVRFDRPILGVSTMEDTLEKGDQLTGYDPQRLLGPASEWKRGLKPPNDFVHIREDGKTLDLRVRKRDGERVPQLRVFVEGE